LISPILMTAAKLVSVQKIRNEKQKRINENL
jgi:hypothetical protein